MIPPLMLKQMISPDESIFTFSLTVHNRAVEEIQSVVNMPSFPSYIFFKICNEPSAYGSADHLPFQIHVRLYTHNC